MDCISVFLRGIQNVIATSGTAFTEQQVAMLRRHTSNVVVNFDPDAAGSNAAEKSIALLTEEGFTIKIVTLDGGLDPDRFIRERGVEAYTAAIRDSRRQSDFLIERARQMFPGASADQKVKAMNYLLPHIRRMPEKLARDQFAGDAAQKLGIDSAVLREELRQAALRRRDHVESRDHALTEVERVLLRALAIDDPENEDCPPAAAQALAEQPPGLSILAPFSRSRHWPPARPGTPWKLSTTRPSAPCLPRPCSPKSSRPKPAKCGRDPGDPGARHRAPPARASRSHCRSRTTRRFASWPGSPTEKLELDREPCAESARPSSAATSSELESRHAELCSGTTRRAPKDPQIPQILRRIHPLPASN